MSEQLQGSPNGVHCGVLTVISSSDFDNPPPVPSRRPAWFPASGSCGFVLTKLIPATRRTADRTIDSHSHTVPVLTCGSLCDRCENAQSWNSGLQTRWIGAARFLLQRGEANRLRIEGCARDRVRYNPGDLNLSPRTRPTHEAQVRGIIVNLQNPVRAGTLL